jgi:hypothetical protein
MLCTLTAQATVEPSVKDTYDSGCVDNFSTEGCFGYSSPTGTGFNGPTVTACIARKVNNQGCRSCMTTYYDNGQPKPYLVCAYVTFTGSCSCKNPSTPTCQGQGYCNYIE